MISFLIFDCISNPHMPTYYTTQNCRVPRSSWCSLWHGLALSALLEEDVKSKIVRDEGSIFMVRKRSALIHWFWASLPWKLADCPVLRSREQHPIQSDENVGLHAYACLAATVRLQHATGCLQGFSSMLQWSVPSSSCKPDWTKASRFSKQSRPWSVKSV